MVVSTFQTAIRAGKHDLRHRYPAFSFPDAFQALHREGYCYSLLTGDAPSGRQAENTLLPVIPAPGAGWYPVFIRL